MLEGVGPDAEIVTNSSGGKQSKAPIAMHLVDPSFLLDWSSDMAKHYEYTNESRVTPMDSRNIEIHSCFIAIKYIAMYMLSPDTWLLRNAMESLESNSIKRITAIAKVLKYGADRYEPNNWRLIPQEDHINHALTHIIANLANDNQDDHIGHALCRLMMAYATVPSEGFCYTSYIK
jgi:hypothetical protein